MKAEEFTSFEEGTPNKNKWLIVTNNIKSLNAYGEMSHVWLTTFWTKSADNSIITFDATESKIYNLTHWKYA